MKKHFANFVVVVVSGPTTEVGRYQIYINQYFMGIENFQIVWKEKNNM